MFLKASNLIFEKAKELRRNPTHAEVLLWNYLRNNQLEYKFRRQHPIADYIVDLYCHELKLVIEIDGGVHSDYEVAIKDKERQDYLERHGLFFLRFTNDKVEKQMEQVIKEIQTYITNCLSPNNMGKPL